MSAIFLPPLAMTLSNSYLQHLNPRSLRKSTLMGAAIGLVLMIIFMYGDNVLYSKPFDFGFRNYFPMITISVGGAAGGFFYGLMEPWRQQGGWVKVAVTVFCMLAFIMALWASSVAGFAVTGDWD